MYRCNDCTATFDEPDEQVWNAADYYGVEKNGHDQMLHINVCPYCGSEDIDEIDDEETEDDDEEEGNK